MKKNFLNTSLLLLVLVFLYNCQNFCNAYNIQRISGLVGGNSIVAWETKCGATGGNRISLTWDESETNLKNKRGKLFEAYHGEKIKIEKIATDTVIVYYWARGIEERKKNSRGIVFI